MLTLSTIIGAVTALIFGAVGLWFGGKYRGKSEQKSISDLKRAEEKSAEQAAQSAARIESSKVAGDAQRKAIESSDAELNEGLSKWTRD